jgi:DNA-binding transcriptional MerR regulator
MNAFTIKDLENLSGIKAHTIRIWEQRYSFLTPQRTETNIRYYSNDELQKVLNIALLNKYGFRISQIDKMSETEINEKILALSESEAQQERLVNELIQAMTNVDMDVFENVLDSYISTNGIEKTITQILFPFLQRIGILWLTNHINPAQEHLVSNLIRQKLMVGIDRLKNAEQPQATALLFLPEGEYHEMGLLFVHYLLKNKGVKVYYIGANVPMKDVECVVSLKNPDLLYTHLTSVAANFSLEKFLFAMNNRLHGKPLIVSGGLSQVYKKKTPPNTSLKRSFVEVMEYISSL